jgi:hypothetical protein
MGIISMKTRNAIITVDGRSKGFDVQLALSDSELSGMQNCAKCGSTGIDTYDFTIKRVSPIWYDPPTAQSNPDGGEVVIGLKCGKCKATKTIERSTLCERMQQVVISRSYIDRQARR